MNINKCLAILSISLLGIFICVYFLLPIETEDIWWHLKAGEYIVQNHQVPHFDPFPFSTEVTPWVLTQWGGSLFYYTVYHFFGLDGLRVTRVILGLLTFALFLAYSSRKIPFVFSLLLTLIIFFPIEARSFLRPDFFNFIFVQIFLIALFAHRDAKNWKPLWIIPLSGIVWVNIHLGSFMYGVLLMGVFLFAYVIESIQRTPGAIKKLRQLSLILLAYLLIFFCTPYGLDGFLHPLKTLFVKDYLRFDLISKSISELQPPIYLFTPYYFWFYVLAAASIFIITQSRQNRFLYTILLAVAAFMFLYGVRAGAFFALVTGALIVDGLSKLNWKHSQRAENSLLITLLIVIVLLTFRGMNVKIWMNNKEWSQHFSLRESTDSPSKTIAILKENQISGLIFNDLIYGGYLLWHEYPLMKPFVDSRQINTFTYEAYLLAKSQPETIWPQLEQQFQIKTVLLNTGRAWNAKIIKYFVKHPGWSLILVSGDCLLFVKKGAFELPAELENFQKDLEAKNLLIDQINAQIPEYPVSENFRTAIKEFFFPAYIYIDQEQTATNLFNLGFKGAALEIMGESLKVIDDIPSRKLLHRMRQK